MSTVRIVSSLKVKPSCALGFRQRKRSPQDLIYLFFYSRVCQKKDWKTRKPDCQRAILTPATSREPVIKALEHLTKDEEIMGWIDVIIVTASSLDTHLENATKYVALISATVIPSPHPADIAKALRDPDVPGETIKKRLHIFQLCRAKPLELPEHEGLNRAVEFARASLVGNEQTTMIRAEDVMVVKVLFVSELSTVASFYTTRYIIPPAIDYVLEQSRLRGAYLTSTEGLIMEVNQQHLEHADIKKNFTVMA